MTHLMIFLPNNEFIVGIVIPRLNLRPGMHCYAGGLGGGGAEETAILPPPRPRGRPGN
jgi:hypothetical protein